MWSSSKSNDFNACFDHFHWIYETQFVDSKLFQLVSWLVSGSSWQPLKNNDSTGPVIFSSRQSIILPVADNKIFATELSTDSLLTILVSLILYDPVSNSLRDRWWLFVALLMQIVSNLTQYFEWNEWTLLAFEQLQPQTTENGIVVTKLFTSKLYFSCCSTKNLSFLRLDLQAASNTVAG